MATYDLNDRCSVTISVVRSGSPWTVEGRVFDRRTGKRVGTVSGEGRTLHAAQDQAKEAAIRECPSD